MSAARKTVVRGAKAKALYASLHALWRAGIVKDFYYGRRGPNDATVVWRLNNREYAADEVDDVAAGVAGLMMVAGIEAAEFGDAWCGYRELVVTRTDGTITVERWDGREVIVEERTA